MGQPPLLLAVDAVTVPVPDLDAGLAFYQGRLGHHLLWRNDAVGQAGLALAAQETELVLTTSAPYAPTWLVESVDSAVDAMVDAGARLVDGPSDVPVGRLAVVEDVFGNQLVLLDTSKGRYVTDDFGRVTGVE
jgi:catechol 2,3-dioxygenase-like lactoylglutathione lyase family enzyme